MAKLTKLDVQKRVLKAGKRLDLNLFTWDEGTKTFSSIESNLVLDFSDLDNCSFRTGYNCSFKAGDYCTFKTGSCCNFETGSDCTFKTGSSCTFTTYSNCTFDTGSDCTFTTGSKCIFKTGSYCTFDTGSHCTFTTALECVVIRRDIFEVILLKKDIETILCPSKIKGYLEKIDDKFIYSEDPNKDNEYITVENKLSRVK